MGQWLSHYIDETAETDTYRDLRLRVYYNASAGTSDGTNTFTVGGGDWPSFSGSKSLSIPGGGGSQLIYDETVRFNKTYGSPYTVDFNASLTGVEYWGSSQVISTSGSATIGARPYGVPAAPTSVTETRVSDTQHTINWVRNATSSAPYQSQEVQRWDVVNQVFVKVATVSGTATSYTDSSTAANNAYQWRIKAINSSGSAASSPSPSAYTSAAAPGSPTATKQSDGSIRVSWTVTWPYTGYTTVVQRQSVNDAGAWTTVAAALASGVTSYTDPSPNAGQQHRYRIRAEATDGVDGALAYTGWVQLAAPPNAPTGLSPNGGVRPFAEGGNFEWNHNPVDSSDQTQFQARMRIYPSGTWVEGSVVTTDNEYHSLNTLLATIGAGDGDLVEWAVKTRGVHATFSPYSATATVRYSARPTVSINAPADGATVTTSVLSATWGYADAEGSAQASWRLTLKQGGQTVETLSAPGTAGSATLSTRLSNFTTYVLEAEVKDGDGLWSAVDSVTFSTNFLPPEDADVELLFDPDGAATAITVSPQGHVVGVSVAATSFTVERSIDGGETWVTYLQDVPIDGAPVTVTDYAPLLGGVNLYRVTMNSATPSSAPTSDSDLTLDTTGLVRAVWLSTGPGFSTGCNVRANVRENATANRVNRVLRHYAGRPKPVSHVGKAVTQGWSVTADMIEPTADPGASSAQEWLALGVEKGPFLLRTPEGLYEIVELTTGGISVSRETGGTRRPLSFSVEAIDG